MQKRVGDHLKGGRAFGATQESEAAVHAALRWLEQDKGQPFFAWVHLYDPHSPYEPPEPYRSQFARRGPAGLYDGEIAYVDAMVGKLVEALRARKVLDDTLIVVTSDHGEHFGEHHMLEHKFSLYEPLLHVPLIVRAPGRVAAHLRIRTPVPASSTHPTPPTTYPV